MGQYQPPPPPPLPGHQQHPNAYPGPPPTPHYSQYGAPPPSYPPGYTQPPYSYPSSQPYAPPAPYGAPPQYSPPGYARPMPGPPPPAPYPGAPAGHDHRSPPPYYGQAHQPPPPPSPFAHSASHHPPRPPPPHPRSAPPASSAQTPPKPPSTRISHPLPPKPPPSQDQIKFQRDHRNKRKHDRQEHQDRRHKDQKVGNKHAGHNPQYDTHASPSSAGRRYSSSQGSPPGRPNHNNPKHHPQQPRKSSQSGGPSHAPTSPEKGSSRPERVAGASKHRPDEAIQAESLGDQAAPVTEVPHGREADRPQPMRITEGVDRVPVVEAPVAGDAAPGRNVEDEAAEAKTISTEQEEGEIANDDAGVSTSSHERATTNQRQRSTSAEPGVHHKRSRSSDAEERQHHKKRRPDSPAPRSDKTSESGTLNGTLWDGLDVPRQADRKRRGSQASQVSKHSSASSKSSDLNSLEAELLGRPVRQKHVADSPPRQRSDRKPVKAKRRQANANSAYRYYPVAVPSRKRVSNIRSRRW